MVSLSTPCFSSASGTSGIATPAWRPMAAQAAKTGTRERRAPVAAALVGDTQMAFRSQRRGLCDMTFGLSRGFLLATPHVGIETAARQQIDMVAALGDPAAVEHDDLVADVRRHGIDSVIVALPLGADHQLVETLNKLSLVPVDVRLCPDRFGLRLGRVSVSHIGGHTFLNVIDRPLRDWRRIAKEIEDRIVAAAILTMISPLLLVIAAAIKLDSRGPVFFRQKRYGFNNELIEVFKFRSMYTDMTDATAAKLVTKDDPRVTRVGRFIRKTSLDELPQLLNVIKGEMSLVGPRPHATEAKASSDLYQTVVGEYFARHRMKPGVTG
ncbi:MAG: sugar transferase, partial [Reyranella sp.]|nr:sugar transferase [Reyranella sp.]